MEQLWPVKAGTPLPCEETYMGTSAFSERETQVSIRQIHKWEFKKPIFPLVNERWFLEKTDQWQIHIGRRRKSMGFWHKFFEFVNVLIETNKILVFNIFSNNATKKLKNTTDTYRESTEKNSVGDSIPLIT
jgi:hypothetical protein